VAILEFFVTARNFVCQAEQGFLSKKEYTTAVVEGCPELWRFHSCEISQIFLVEGYFFSAITKFV
jgi:hypothetical protein